MLCCHADDGSNTVDVHVEGNRDVWSVYTVEAIQVVGKLAEHVLRAEATATRRATPQETRLKLGVGYLGHRPER